MVRGQVEGGGLDMRSFFAEKPGVFSAGQGELGWMYDGFSGDIRKGQKLSDDCVMRETG